MKTESTDKKTEERITITPPNIKIGEVWIKGNAPLVIKRFAQKGPMMESMEAGSTTKKGKKKEAKDFDKEFNDARHISFDGWDGIHAAAFRNACVQACALTGFKKTNTKMSVFVIEDGWDREDGVPLVKIIGPAPRRLDSVVRVGGATKVATVTARPQWLQWGARLRFRYDADQFTASDVVNLISRAGLQVGVCEGRPGSSTSCGMGWGTFEISTEEDVMALEGKAAK